MNLNSEQMITTFSGSKKVYEQGSRTDIRVPMREISLSPTEGYFGKEENKPVRVYDTSGPYTDPNVEIDIQKGLGKLRKTWVLEREDVEEYLGRDIKPEDNGGHEETNIAELFPNTITRPLKA